MHRTQILLDDRQYQRMKNLAEREGRSLSSLVRDAVTMFLERKTRRPATKLAEIAGIGDDPDCRGRDHDDFLYRPRRDRS
jgi:predicted transcriptional regulator